MLLKIIFESDIPIYVQMKQQIIEGIAKGELKEGESLPSVRQMAQDIGINMLTVNKAYTLLKNDGFITIDRRKGAVVSASNNMVTEEYLDELKNSITAIIAEAYCRGVKEYDFIKMCGQIFNIYNKGDN